MFYLGDSIMSATPVKPFLTFEEQLQHLIKDKGLIVPDEAAALETLRQTNYYRLINAYSLTLIKGDHFYPSTTFEQIVELYRFDEALRSIILKYTQAVEIFMRTTFAHYFSKQYGSLGYLTNGNFEDPWRHAKFVEKLSSLLRYSNEVFIEHHKTKYHGQFPLWVAVEVMTFDVLSKAYKNMKPEDRQLIAKQTFGVPRAYVENWLECTVVARNISAHNGRFYNRPLRIPVKLPKTVKAAPNRFFAYFYAIWKLLPGDELQQQLVLDIKNLFIKYSFAEYRHLGFPTEWEKYLV